MEQASNVQYNLPRHTFFIAVLITELTLFLCFLGSYYLDNYYLSPLPTYWEISRGLMIAAPVVFLNWFILASPKVRLRLPATASFLDNIMYPICRRIGLFKIGIISLLAGVCEELFFRLAFQSKFTTLVSALVYTYFHFGTNSIHYRFLSISYLLLALYLGSLTTHFGTIWPAIVAHATFNCFSMLYLKYFYRPLS